MYGLRCNLTNSCLNSTTVVADHQHSVISLRYYILWIKLKFPLSHQDTQLEHRSETAHNLQKLPWFLDPANSLCPLTAISCLATQR